jgi:hypothetical protein
VAASCAGALTSVFDHRGGLVVSSSGGSVQMDPEGVKSAAVDATQLASAVDQMHTYATGDSLGEPNFGDIDGGSAAWTAFSTAATALADSVDKAHTFLDDAANRMTTSASTTTATDEDAAWNITSSGKGA